MEENKQSKLLNHIGASILFSISTFILEVFAFGCLFIVWCNLFAEEGELSKIEAFSLADVFYQLAMEK